MKNVEVDEHIQFVELEFDPKDVDVEDHVIMSTKHYKILRLKI